MKKYLSMLMLSAALGYSAKGEGNSSNRCMEQMVSNVSSVIKNDFNSWNFTSIDAKSCYAMVIFSVSETGDVAIENIISDNDSFKKLVVENLSRLKVESTNTHMEPVLFKVALKHKRI